MKFWMSIGARLYGVVYEPNQLEIGVEPSLTVPSAYRLTFEDEGPVLVKMKNPAAPPGVQVPPIGIPKVQAPSPVGLNGAKSKLSVPVPGAPEKTIKAVPDVTPNVRSLIVPVSVGAIVPPEKVT